VKSSDLVVLNNITEFNPREIEWITSHKPYIRWEHGYSYRRPKEKEFYLRIFKNSLCNIFLSPLHFEEHRKDVPLENAMVMPSPMNVDLFKDHNLDRDIDFLFVGRFSPPKGVTNVLNLSVVNPDKAFYFTGSGPLESFIRQYKNCTVLRDVPYEKMPELYSRAKKLVHLPLWPEPFGRVVLEAYLCGCELIVNGRIGALSYNFPFHNESKVRTLLKEAPVQAWKKIGEIFERNLG